MPIVGIHKNTDILCYLGLQALAGMSLWMPDWQLVLIAELRLIGAKLANSR